MRPPTRRLAVRLGAATLLLLLVSPLLRHPERVAERWLLWRAIPSATDEDPSFDRMDELAQDPTGRRALLTILFPADPAPVDSWSDALRSRALRLLAPDDGPHFTGENTAEPPPDRVVLESLGRAFAECARLPVPGRFARSLARAAKGDEPLRRELAGAAVAALRHGDDCNWCMAAVDFLEELKTSDAERALRKLALEHPAVYVRSSALAALHLESRDPADHALLFSVVARDPGDACRRVAAMRLAEEFGDGAGVAAVGEPLLVSIELATSVRLVATFDGKKLDAAKKALEEARASGRLSDPAALEVLRTLGLLSPPAPTPSPVPTPSPAAADDDR